MSLFATLPIQALEPLQCAHWVADEDGLESDQQALVRASQAILIAADHLTVLSRLAYAAETADQLSAASVALRASVSLLR